MMHPRRIRIRIACSGDRFLKLEISVQETVGELKKILAHDDEYLRKDVHRTDPHGHIRLFFNGKVLNDDKRTLGDCGLEDESCVMAAVRFHHQCHMQRSTLGDVKMMIEMLGLRGSVGWA